MRKTTRHLLTALAIGAGVASPFASAKANTLTASYGWEDGSGTILGSSGNLSNPANVATGTEVEGTTVDNPSVTPYAGSQMLTVSESPNSGTPEAYVAYVQNLSAGDTVTASFYGFDDTASADPALRIWGHYSDSGRITGNDGSASGNSTYTDGSGWSQLSNTWTIGSGHSGLIVEARLYSGSGDPTSYFLDNLDITANTQSTRASITTPGGTTVVPEPASFGLIALSTLGLLPRLRRHRE